MTGDLGCLPGWRTLDQPSAAARLLTRWRQGGRESESAELFDGQRSAHSGGGSDCGEKNAAVCVEYSGCVTCVVLLCLRMDHLDFLCHRLQQIQHLLELDEPYVSRPYFLAAPRRSRTF